MTYPDPTPSLIPVVVDSLLATLTAVVPAGVVVYDGPLGVPATSQQWVAVGWDGEPGNDLSAETSQSYPGIGGRVRDEFIDVQCVAAVLQGDGGLQNPRAAVFQLVATLEVSLRATPDLAAGVLWAEFSTGRLHQTPSSRGLLAKVPFTVHARCRI